MGLFKRCKHTGRTRDRCGDPWWGSFQHHGTLYRVSLSKWANEDIASKQQAQAIYERFRKAVRDGQIRSEENRQQRPITFDELVS